MKGYIGLFFLIIGLMFLSYCVGHADGYSAGFRAEAAFGQVRTHQAFLNGLQIGRL